MNGDTSATCSVLQDRDDRIRLEIGLVTECSTERGIEVIGCTALHGPQRWHIDRAVDTACTSSSLWARFKPRDRRCAPIVTDAFAPQPSGSVIRVRVIAHCIGSGKTVWGSAHCIMPS